MGIKKKKVSEGFWKHRPSASPLCWVSLFRRLHIRLCGRFLPGDSTGLVWDNGMVNMLWFALLTNSLTFWWNVVKPKWREAWTWHRKPTLRCDNHCSPQLTMVTGFEFYVRSASSSMKYIHRRPLQRFSQCGCGQPCLFTSKPFRCVIISDTLCLEQIQKWNKLTTNVF